MTTAPAISKSLSELAQALDAQLVGNPDQTITAVMHPLQARDASHLALILDEAVVAKLAGLGLQTALVPEGVAISGIPNQLVVRRPKVALAKLLDIFERPVYIPEGIHPTAVIHPTAQVAPDAKIGPYCVIGPEAVIGARTRLVSHVHIGAQARVGEDCLLFPGVYVGDRVVLGARVILQANATIGSDGFSYVTPEAGSVESVKATGEVSATNTGIIRINSIGTVVLEDDVEIGANSCVDRATLGETRIGRGSKIDNQVQVAHNVTLGENCLFAAQVGIAGSTKIGHRVVMGGQVGVRDHVTVGDDTVVVAKSGITSDVAPKTILMGLQGMPRKDFLRREVQMNKLSGVPNRLKELTERVDQLEAKLLPEGQPV